MGVRRLVRKLVLEPHRRRTLRTAKSIRYEGLTVPLSGDHMAREIVRQIYDEEYERPEIRGVGGVVRENDRVLELGTGLGIVTSIAARTAGQGRVLSYEANPALLEPAAELFRTNNIQNVDARHGVLTADALPGERDFLLAEFFPEGSMVAVRSQRGSVKVPSWPIAGVIKEFQPDVMICDIEGAEAELLPAVDKSGLRAAVIEFHPAAVDRQTIWTLCRSFADAGLLPALEFSSGNVVTFERPAPP